MSLSHYRGRNHSEIEYQQILLYSLALVMLCCFVYRNISKAVVDVRKVNLNIIFYISIGLSQPLSQVFD